MFLFKPQQNIIRPLQIHFLWTPSSKQMDRTITNSFTLCSRRRCDWRQLSSTVWYSCITQKPSPAPNNVSWAGGVITDKCSDSDPEVRGQRSQPVLLSAGLQQPVTGTAAQWICPQCSPLIFSLFSPIHPYLLLIEFTPKAPLVMKGYKNA